MTTMDDLAAFFAARLDEEEANARDAMALWPHTHFTIDPGSLVVVKFHCDHDPARVLREVTAKRAIVERHAPDQHHRSPASRRRGDRPRCHR